jgi:arylsulfatase A-like enzyme
MPKPRSIVWIVTTQWRGQAWGGGGDPQAHTPVLDRLAAEGINYRQATTPHPFGPFARAAMLTGVPSPENGVKDYYDPLPTDACTVAHLMRDAGCRTAWFGKWHLSERDRDAPLVGEIHARQVVPPEARGGFDFWEGFEGGFQLNNQWLHGSRLSEPSQFFGYQSDVVMSRAGDWLQARAEPCFAVVSVEPPHPPYGAPVPSGTPLMDPVDVALPANVPPEAAARARQELAGYYNHIAATDRAIGELVAKLPEEVIVVVTSVHGDMHGAHGLFRKGWPHEESVRVPFIVRGAPGRKGGGINDEPVSLLDLPAMTQAWTWGEHWSCPRDRAPLSMPSVVNLPDQCDRTWTGWRSGTRKEIYGPGGEPWLAYDLSNDPLEENNLG